MDRQTHKLCESIQEITLQAWPIIYGKNNPYDLDSRAVLETFRLWGEEFETWWKTHDSEWIDVADYRDEIMKFTDQKVGAYLRELLH